MTTNVADNEVEKQIRNMTAFIDQEANEKVEEIEAKTEEEFQIEKSKFVQEQRSKLMEYYTKKENQIEMSKKIQNSNSMNSFKLKVLSAKQEHISKLMELAKHKLEENMRDMKAYQRTLKLLIEQGFFQLLECNVIIRCRRNDVEVVKLALVEAIEGYQTATKQKVMVQVDNQVFLDNCIGGVEMLTLDGKIRVVNTLDSRLQLIGNQMIPEIKEVLFGSNENRKFQD